MTNLFPDGLWPVMITPFTSDNKIDYKALTKLIYWYEENGSDGLFAVCQSSEMFFLSLEERVKLAKFVKEHSKIPVIASGHTADQIDDQAYELQHISSTGVDAVILISNRLAGKDEDDAFLLRNLDKLLKKLPEDIPLGFYECPHPYKKLLSPEVIQYIVNTARFSFIKDTSCDIDNIKAKLEITKGSKIKLFNANTATLLESLKSGAAGYSGVMANFHPQLYRWILDNYDNDSFDAQEMQNVLTICSLIECRNYPRNAKYMQQLLGNGFKLVTRKEGDRPLTKLEREEVNQLKKLTQTVESLLNIRHEQNTKVRKRG